MNFFPNARWLQIPAVGALLIATLFSIPAPAADELDSVIARLDASATKFKSAQADITWDNVQTQPIPDTDRQAGTIVLERKGGETQVGLHIKTDNGKPVLKDMVYAGGIGKLYTPATKQMQVFKVGDKKTELDAFLTLGFGGSGQDLKKNWQVTSLGTEQVDGVTAAKLQLIPRDPAVAKTAPKVILWIDMNKGVAVKQQRFNGDSGYVTFGYSNIRINGPLPSGAFEIKPASGTQVMNH
jgi:outer membrane lipoprotein-sorting protein